MKKEISPGVIIGAIAGLLAVVVVLIMMVVKSDPASRAPHEPPRFDPGAKAAESVPNNPNAPAGVRTDTSPASRTINPADRNPNAPPGGR